MSICHTYHLVARKNLLELYARIDRVLGGEPLSVLGELVDLEKLMDDYGHLEVVTRRRGLIRRREDLYLEPGPVAICKSYLEHRPEAENRFCCVDQLFYRWPLTDKGVENLGLFRKAVWGTTTAPIPKHHVDEGLSVIDEEVVPTLIATANELIIVNKDALDSESGVQETLTEFCSLLESRRPDDIIVVDYG